MPGPRNNSRNRRSMQRGKPRPPLPPEEPFAGVIERLAWGGNGLCRMPDGRIVLLEAPLALFPGEEVEALVRFRKRHGNGYVTAWRRHDKRRGRQGCTVAQVCGGCNLWEAGEAYAELKQLMVEDLFNRNLKNAPTWDFKPAAPDARRSRIQLHWNGRRLGYHRSRERAIVAVSSCPMADPLVSAAVPRLAEALREHALPVEPDRWELATGTPAKHVIATGENQPGMAWRLSNDTWEPCQEPLTHECGGISLRQSPGAFFQACPAWAWEAFGKVFDDWGLEGRTLFDLYGGGGFFSRMLKDRFSEFVLVEGNTVAVRDAKANLCGMDVAFHPQEVSNWLPKQLGKAGDVVILDPPRSGMQERVVNKLKGAGASHLVLVGCDGAMFCRDVSRFAPEWQLEKLSVIDLFPNTAHVECVGLLTRR